MHRGCRGCGWRKPAEGGGGVGEASLLFFHSGIHSLDVFRYSRRKDPEVLEEDDSNSRTSSFRRDVG